MNDAPTETLTPPLKWHGGKAYLADRIVALMPPHLHYVEAFAGGLSVLLAKDPEGVSEVANDLNGWLTNFWRVLADPHHFGLFRRQVEATPFSEPVFDDALAVMEGGFTEDMDRVDAARAFFIVARQSMAGRLKHFTPLSRTRTRRGMNEQASAWMNVVEGLPAVSRRLMRVVITNKPADELILQQDGSDTLFYCDPPYVPETRTARQAYGAFEMTPAQHEQFLYVCVAAKGKVMVSGYDNELYRRHLRDWTRHEFDLPNNAAGGLQKRRMTEVLWCNF
jgi:DNA adenine methylase